MSRVHTPTFIQMEATECGAVCLQIILAYYGKFVSLEELRINCGVSRDGSSALFMIEAAEGYGLKGEGLSCEIEDLYDQKFPLILFWKFEHFLVLEGFDKKCVYVNDPATGPRTITYEDLDASFTGVVLTFKPTESFVKSKPPPNLIQTLYQRLYAFKIPLAYVFIASLCLLVLNLTIPAFARLFVDQVLVLHDSSWKVFLIAGMVVTITLVGIVTFLQGYALNWLKLKLNFHFSSMTLWHMLRLNYSFYTQRYPGEIAYRLTLNDSLAETVTTTLVPIVLWSIFVVVYCALIFYYDFALGITIVIATLLNSILTIYVYRSRQNAYARYQADIGKSNSFSLGALQTIETIKATGFEFKFFSLWVAYFSKIINGMQEIGKKDVILGVSQPLLAGLTSVAVIGIGGWRILQGNLTIGMFIAIIILLYSLIVFVNQIIVHMRSLQMFKVDLARLDDIMRYPIDPLLDSEIAEEGKETLKKLEGYIELRHVSFQYSPRDPYVLKDISMVFRPGTTTALVGPTGCGKSTVTKLISGLYKPTLGEILFDGKPLELIPRMKVTNSLSVIEQEPFIFSGTINDNLTLMGSHIFQEDIIHATKDAVIHAHILSRKGGYESEVLEMGANLSGGQRQCIEIARGLIKNPTIIILDESTSSLDSDTEKKLITNVLRRGCTILMIAHRLSTIRNCDEIVVMEKGSIVARGTHQELMDQGGLYKELVESEHLEI